MVPGSPFWNRRTPVGREAWLLRATCSGTRTCVGLLISGQLSQASPTASLSLSVCSGFGTFGQLSRMLGIPEEKQEVPSSFRSSTTNPFQVKLTKKNEALMLARFLCERILL